MIRGRHGEILPPRIDGRSVRLSYRGLDDVVRTTTLTFHPAPEKLTSGMARHRLTLPPGEAVDFRRTVTATQARAPATRPVRRHAPPSAEPEPTVSIVTANASFDEWVARAWADLRMLTTETEDGRIAYAGIPWFVAPFGRDSIITA